MLIYPPCQPVGVARSDTGAGAKQKTKKMKRTLTVCIIALLCAIADSFSDNPDKNPPPVNNPQPVCIDSLSK